MLKTHSNRFLLILIGLFAGSSFSLLQAQSGYRPHPFLSPMWQADVEYLPATQIEDTSLSNGFTGANFTMRIPIWKKKDWLDANGGKPFFAVMSHVGASARMSQISFLDPDRLLTVGRASVTGLMAKGLRNLYVGQIGIALPTESFYFNPAYLCFNGSLIWRHLYHNNRWWHTLGIVYLPIQGRDLPLPVAGIGVKLSNENQLQLTFPFNLMYTHTFSRKFSLSGKLHNFGGYNYLKADTVHDVQPLAYRYNYRKLSLIARYYTDRFVVLTGEAGVTGKSNISLDDVDYHQASTFYLKFSIQVRFGERPTAAPILNFDPGDSGFDPNYIVE